MRVSNFCLAVSFGLFVVFVADVLLGKARVALGWTVPLRLGDVGEYLTLLFAALCLTVATLLREHQSRIGDTPSGPDRIADQP